MPRPLALTLGEPAGIDQIRQAVPLLIQAFGFEKKLFFKGSKV